MLARPGHEPPSLPGRVCRRGRPRSRLHPRRPLSYRHPKVTYGYGYVKYSTWRWMPLAWDSRISQICSCCSIFYLFYNHLERLLCPLSAGLTPESAAFWPAAVRCETWRSTLTARLRYQVRQLLTYHGSCGSVRAAGLGASTPSGGGLLKGPRLWVTGTYRYCSG